MDTKVKSNIDSGQFKPMQYAAVEALSAKKEWYDNMNRVYVAAGTLPDKSCVPWDASTTRTK